MYNERVQIGSPVSHAAIVAREYSILVVVAVDTVTNILRWTKNSCG
ncbi:PEP-utilizing enzyme [Desulfosporosinus sp. Sb-LF]|nr:PEP-utilizing enzyme [Desulfosporosinus sp. Sb-LF]